MRIGAIGVGQAGGRILDAFVYNNIWGGHKDVLPLTLAINAAKADLLGLSSVPRKDRILLGHTLVKGTEREVTRRWGPRWPRMIRGT